MKDARDQASLSVAQMLAFLQHELPETEMNQIEEQIQSDPLQLLALQELDLALRAGSSPAELLAQAERNKRWAQQEIDAQLNQAEGRLKNVAAPGPRRWMVAAIVLLLILPLGYWWTRPAPETLLAEQALAFHYPVPGTRGAGASLPQLMEQAYAAYSQDQYNEALPYFEQLLTTYEGELTENQRRDVLLFQGISLLKAKPAQAEQAIQTLQAASQLAEGQSDDIQSAAQWYQALAYLHQNNLAQAAQMMEPLSRKPNRFQRKAQALLPQVKALQQTDD